MSKIDWSKAPDGYPIWIEGPDGYGGWHKDDGDRYTDTDGCYWTKPDEGYYTVHTKPKQSNEWLPPIGETAFVYDPEGVLMYGAGESGEVIAHVENTAVIRMSYGLGCFTAKHLKTSEQLAKLERSKECDKIYGILIGVERQGNRSDMAEALYDAGYRKQKD